MDSATPFNAVLEAAERLTLAEQEALVDILHRRTIEQRRAELAGDIREAQEEHRAGSCRVVTADELMREVLS